MSFDLAPHLSALSHKDASRRESAARVLGAHRVEEAVEPLRGLLTDRAPMVRAAAVEALGRIGDARVGPWVVPLMKDRDSWVRAAAVEAAGRLAYPEAAALLMKSLRDSEYMVRGWGVWALGLLPALPEARPVVALLRDPILWVRERAHATLHRHWSTEARSAVEEAASHRDPLMRRNAAALVAAVRDAACEGAMLRLLGDRSADVRLQAVWALGRMKSPAAMGPMQRLLATDPSEQVRAACVSMLGVMGGAEVLSALSAAVQDESAWVRRNVAWALLHLGTDEAATTLAPVRDDEDDAAAFYAYLADRPGQNGNTAAR